MYKNLLRPPLQQALFVYWLTSLFLVGRWAVIANPTLLWAFCALLCSFLSILVAGQFRIMWILSIAVALTLGGILAIGDIVHLPASVLWTLTILYALLLWIFVQHVLKQPLTGRFISLLKFEGGWGEKGGYQQVETTVHWSCFTLVIFSLLLPALQDPNIKGIPLGSLTNITLGLIFLWLTGQRFRLPLHAHLFTALGAWMMLSFYALFLPSNEQAKGYVEPLYSNMGLVLGLYALVLIVIARRVNKTSHDSDDNMATLFYGPLVSWSIIFASLTALMTLIPGLSGWSEPTKMGLASITLLLAGHLLTSRILTPLGTVLAVITLSWIYSEANYGIPPFELWPGGDAAFEQWVLLGILTFVLACIDRFLIKSPELQQVYQRPLYAITWFMFSWTLLGTIILLPSIAATSITQALISLALIALVLLATLFPLLGPQTKLRGEITALMACALITSLLATESLQQWQAVAAIGCTYAFWLIGTIVLPYTNKHLHRWAIDGEIWPWVGLFILCESIILEWPAILVDWKISLIISGYLFLLSRNSPSFVFPWGAVLLLFWSGMSSGIFHEITAKTLFNPTTSTDIAIEKLLWANMLLLLIPYWRRHGKTITSRLALHYHSLDTPLIFATATTGIFWTCLLFTWTLAPLITGGIFQASDISFTPALIILSLTYLHLVWHSHNPLFAHLMLISVGITVLSIWNRDQLFSLSLLLALWGVIITILNKILTPYAHWFSRLINKTAAKWIPWSIGIATMGLILLPDVSFSERLGSLAILTGLAAYIGWNQLSFRWLVVAVIMTVSLAHGLWLIGIPIANYRQIIPWYALQSALFTWMLVWLTGKYHFPDDRGQPQPHAAKRLVIRVLKEATPWISTLAVLEWSLPSVVFFSDLAPGYQLTPPYGLDASIVYLATTLILAGLSIHMARKTQLERWVYGTAALISVACCYFRMQWVGLAPISPWDTAAIMASAYGLFLLERVTLSHPVFHLTMALPLLAIVTVPYQMGSVHSTLTLLAAGSLYLLTRRTTEKETPLYLGLLAINAAIYLWVPNWSERFGLFQVYLVPVSLSILLLLHLHRNELKKNVLHSSRLATLTLLYAASTMDVFLVETLAVFALATAVSFGSILIGIGLRIRAFLYSGVVFLVINVIGQLILLYPEQRLGKALMLIGIGTVVTGTMIWLNIKRELILERIRIFRADLLSWE